MCRLLAFASTTDVAVGDIAGAEACDDFQRLARLHNDGWGAVWLRRGTGPGSMRRFRTQQAGLDDRALTFALREERSRAGLVHLRMATHGLPVQLENTHPFLVAGIGFAHNGAIKDTVRLRGLVSPASLRAVEGTTDSELYHALIRDRVRDGLSLVDAVRAAVAGIRTVDPVASLNAVLLTRTQLVVVRSSKGAAVPFGSFARRGIARDAVPLDHDTGYYRMMWARTSRGLVFASSGLDPTRWRELPEDSVTSVPLATLRPQTTPLREPRAWESPVPAVSMSPAASPAVLVRG